MNKARVVRTLSFILAALIVAFGFLAFKLKQYAHQGSASAGQFTAVNDSTMLQGLQPHSPEKLGPPYEDVVKPLFTPELPFVDNFIALAPDVACSLCDAQKADVLEPGDALMKKLNRAAGGYLEYAVKLDPDTSIWISDAWNAPPGQTPEQQRDVRLIYKLDPLKRHASKFKPMFGDVYFAIGEPPQSGEDAALSNCTFYTLRVTGGEVSVVAKVHTLMERWGCLIVTDLDGDGVLEAMLYATSGSNFSGLYLDSITTLGALNGPQGQPCATVKDGTAQPDFETVGPPSLSDLNGDGQLELLLGEHMWGQALASSDIFYRAFEKVGGSWLDHSDTLLKGRLNQLGYAKAKLAAAKRLRDKGEAMVCRPPGYGAEIPVFEFERHLYPLDAGDDSPALNDSLLSQSP